MDYISMNSLNRLVRQLSHSFIVDKMAQQVNTKLYFVVAFFKI